MEHKWPRAGRKTPDGKYQNQNSVACVKGSLEAEGGPSQRRWSLNDYEYDDIRSFFCHLQVQGK